MDKMRLWPEIVDLDELAESGSQTFPVAEYKDATISVTVSRLPSEDHGEGEKYDLHVENPGSWQYHDSCGATRPELDAALKNLTDSLTEENFFTPGLVAEGMPEREALSAPAKGREPEAPSDEVIDVPTVDHLIGNVRFREDLGRLNEWMLPGESARWQAGELDLEVIKDEQGLIVSKNGHDLTEKDLNSLAITKGEARQFSDFVTKMLSGPKKGAEKGKEERGRTPSDRDPADRDEKMPERIPGMNRAVPEREREDGIGETFRVVPMRTIKKELSPDEIRKREEERRRREKQKKRAHAMTKISTHSAKRDVYRGYELSGNAEHAGGGSERYDDYREQEDVLIKEAEMELG